MVAPFEIIAERLQQEEEYIRLCRFHENQQHTFQTIDRHEGKFVTIQGRNMLNFVSALYLDISHEPSLIDAYERTIRYWGTLSGCSRFSFKTRVEKQLEETVSTLLGTEDCLFYQTTGLVSLGVLSAICKTKNDVIIFDQYAHKTIQKAIRLASSYGVTCIKIGHNNLGELEMNLKSHSQGLGNVIVAVDGIYSMTGNHNDLAEFDTLARKYGAMLYVDDAHGFGLMGDGKGIVHHLNLSMDNMLYVGSFQKNFGGYGSFVATNKKIGDYLRKMCHTYIFAGPPPTGGVGFDIAALEFLKTEGDKRRKSLFEVSQYVINELRSMGYSVDNDTGFPLICPVVGKDDLVAEMASEFWDNNILILPVTYPIVPKDKSLFRLTLCSSIQREDTDRALDVFKKFANRLN